MSFVLESGLIISNPLFSILILILWGYLLKRNFEFSLSLLVVGSFLIQYTEINLFVWTGTLLLPLGIIASLFIVPKLFFITNKFDPFTKRMFILISVYFFLVFIQGLFMASNFILFLTKVLFDFTRIYLPFYGIFLLPKKNGSLIKHLKYNAYISCFICIGYILTIVSGSSFNEINSIRNVMFWNMPIGAFSSLALWCLFYFVSKLLLESNSNKIYLYLILLLPVVVIFFSQSRGLLPSIMVGLIGILLLSKNTIRGILPLLITIFIVLFITTSVNLNINEEKVSITEIYYDRFDTSLGSNIITDDSRYNLWQNAIESIMLHPIIGGANIKNKIGAHNFYLETLMQFGLFGLLYMIILFIDLKKLIKFIFKFKKVINNDLLIIIGATLAIFYHAIVGGFLGGTYTFFYWSIATLLSLRKEIFLSMKLSKKSLVNQIGK